MLSKSFTLSGRIVDVVNNRIFGGEVVVMNGLIADVRESHTTEKRYLMPGLIDAHVHVESSMLIPSEFARLAVVHGTVGTVSDPHEIANVVGVEGVQYMIDNGKRVPFRFAFGAPSCVPATSFETAGAAIDANGVKSLLAMDDVMYLSEMMNFPGVLNGDEEVMKKIAAARRLGKPVDGHAPGLRGDDARRYAAAGITTDHECFTEEEALDKIRCGMKIIIREGSAAKNFNALIGLLDQYPDKVMFCSDDKHPNELAAGHINQLLSRAVKEGCDAMNALRAATLNPIQHYRLSTGLLRKGDPADFIVITDLETFQVTETWIGGQKVAENGRSLIEPVEEKVINRFNCREIRPEDIAVKAEGGSLRIIEALDGQLITNKVRAEPTAMNGYAVSDPERDILKMTVVNRYIPAAPAMAFIKKFGLKRGAIASSVAHDSHNIIAVGVDDTSIVRAVNAVVKNKGGISLVSPAGERVLPLPVAGLMAASDGYSIASQYEALDRQAKALGSTLSSPFMTLSFMALLVIPKLKLSDKGLFDGEKFNIISLFIK